MRGSYNDQGIIRVIASLIAFNFLFIPAVFLEEIAKYSKKQERFVLWQIRTGNDSSNYRNSENASDLRVIVFTIIGGIMVYQSTPRFRSSDN